MKYHCSRKKISLGFTFIGGGGDREVGVWGGVGVH